MPFLQQQSAVFRDQPVDPTKLRRAKPDVPGKGNGIEPELGGLVVAVYMYMRWFIRLVAVEVHAIGPFHQDGRHELQYRTACKEERYMCPRRKERSLRRRGKPASDT